MKGKGFGISVLAASLVFPFSGCSSMPGNAQQQGAVIGGASGAAVGAAVSKNRALGAVIGGAVGAAGGYVVGKNKDKILGHDNEAKDAERNSQAKPVTVEEARHAKTADVNSDGFVTMDEIVALKGAGSSDAEMIDRLKSSGQIFSLTDDQKKYLRDQGIGQEVIDQMALMNKEAIVPKPSVPNNTEVIGRPR